MQTKKHWEEIYATKRPSETSWFRPHLDISIDLIHRAAPDPSAAIIDVGGGESTLVDDLVASGYRDVTVLDISPTAIDHAKKRLSASSSDTARNVTWLVGDVVQVALPANRYDVWHDRAAFHFLTQVEQRAAYIQQAANAIKSGGHLIISTFGPEGPEKCSSLNIMRYDAKLLHAEFGPRFHLVESFYAPHETPFGTTQQFLYCTFARQ